MYFQLATGAASLSITSHGGRPYIFPSGKPIPVANKADAEEFRVRKDLAECSKAGLKPKAAGPLKPKSIVTFKGPKSEPRPQAAPHEPTPREMAIARGNANG